MICFLLMKYLTIGLMFLICCESKATNDCEDTLSSGNKFTFNDGNGKTHTYKDCTKFVKNWSRLCKKELGIAGKGGRCCASCGDPDCLDQLSQNYKYVLGRDTNYEVSITSCSQMVNKYPILCKTQKDLCCRACKGIDLRCQDEIVRFPFRNRKYTCSEYVNVKPCSCYDNESVIRNCCASCKRVDVKQHNCHCRNKLSKSNWISLPKPDDTIQKITSCKRLASRYPVLCKTHGNKDGDCCQDCQGIDVSCVDELRSFIMPDKLYKSCRSLVDDQPCYCQMGIINHLCCQSCKDIDVIDLECHKDSGKCQDTLKPSHNLTALLLDEDGNVLKSKFVRNCFKLLKLQPKFPDLCKNYGQLDGLCCKSCKDINNL